MTSTRSARTGYALLTLWPPAMLPDTTAISARLGRLDDEADAGVRHYDLASFPVPRQFDALLTITTLVHLHYGSDYPFTPEFVAAMAAERLAAAGDAPRLVDGSTADQHGTTLPRTRRALALINPRGRETTAAGTSPWAERPARSALARVTLPLRPLQRE
jgi:hypothetical protein